MSEGERIAIVGTAVVVRRPEEPPQTVKSLALRALAAASADAGLPLKDVDAVLVTPTGRFRDPRVGYALGEYSGLYWRRISANNDGGSGATGLSLDIARWALADGRCSYVAMVDGGRWGDLAFQEWALRGDDEINRIRGHAFPDESNVYGAIRLHELAAIATRHQFEFATTPEQLAAVAVAARYNASLNPQARHRDPLTVDEVLASPMISSPLRMLMCSTLDDGAAAVIVTTESRARELPCRPVFIAGTGSAFAGRTLSRMHGPDYDAVRGVGPRAAVQAFGEAGVKPDDIDVAAWSDPTALSTIMALEDYGFCERGAGGEFVGGGEVIRVGGRLPVNSHGGWLSGSFACASHGGLVETVRQLQGACGERQVPAARLAFFAAIGGVHSAHSVAILSNS